MGILRRMSALHIARAHVEIGLRLFDRNSGAEANDGFQVMAVARTGTEIFTQSAIDLGGFGGETGRQQRHIGRSDADHRVDAGIQKNGLTDDVGVGMEAAAPQRVREHHDVVRAVAVFGGQEEPAPVGMDAHDVEVSRERPTMRPGAPRVPSR